MLSLGVGFTSDLCLLPARRGGSRGRAQFSDWSWRWGHGTGVGRVLSGFPKARGRLGDGGLCRDGGVAAQVPRERPAVCKRHLVSRERSGRRPDLRPLSFEAAAVRTGSSRGSGSRWRGRGALCSPRLASTWRRSQRSCRTAVPENRPEASWAEGTRTRDPDTGALQESTSGRQAHADGEWGGWGTTPREDADRHTRRR